MFAYRLYLTDRDGRFVDVCAEEHGCDERALAAAERLSNRATAIEVWQAARFVGRRRSQRRRSPQFESSVLAEWLARPC